MLAFSFLIRPCRPDGDNAAPGTPAAVTATPIASLDAESCYSACQALGSPAGTAYTTVGIDASGTCNCYSSSTFTGTDIDDDAMCNIQCAGNSVETCGSGADPDTTVFSVYSVSHPLPAPVLEGCFL